MGSKCSTLPSDQEYHPFLQEINHVEAHNTLIQRSRSQAQTSQVEGWSLTLVLFCMLQTSGEVVVTAGGGCSSRNTLFPSL